MATTKYTLSFEKFAMVFIVTYVSGKFKRMDHKKGKYDDGLWPHLCKAVPFLEERIPEVELHLDHRVKFAKEGSDQMTIYAQFLDVYREWYIHKFEIKPKMDGIEGKALKVIIKYFVDNSVSEAEALISWEAVLSHWGALDPFYQKQTQLRQISSNISNIIIQIKDDTGNTMENARSRKV